MPDAAARFDTALGYAYQTQKNYSDWLDGQALLNQDFGLAEIALAGAAIGLGTVGGNTNAVAALATGAGAIIAADQLAIGVPGKDPRYKAYAAGIIQLQCVIDDSWAAVPKSTALRGNAPPVDLGTILSNLDRAEADVAATMSSVQDTPACAALPDARMALAQATTARQRADLVRAELAALPSDIVSAVHAIHWQAYTQYVTALPDISAIKITPVSTKPGAPRAASGLAERFTRAQAAPVAVCPVAAIAALKEAAAVLNNDLLGVALPQPRFAECTKPPPAPAQGAGAPAALPLIMPSSAAAVEPLAVQPSTDFPAMADKPNSISVIGGRAPIFVVGVEPGLTIIRKPASGTASLNLEVTSTAGPHRLLVTDMTGSQLVVTINAR